MQHLTVRKVDPELARSLRREQKRRGTSLNQTVLELLRQSLGLGSDGKEFDNGLGRFGGTWTQEQFEEFERNTACFGKIDEDMWK